MKRILCLLVTMALFCPLGVRAQDAATQERLDKLSGRIEDLTAAQEALKKQITEMSRELENVREQSGKPNTSYARQEDLSLLEKAIKEVDRKRVEDAEKIQTQLLNLRKVLEAPPPQTKKSSVTTPKDPPVTGNPSAQEKGFEHVVKPGETLDAIALGCKEKNLKVTVAQIIKANPGLKAERLKVGQKIFIPAPQP